ncbi:MAG TPA: fused MFS/spermidine synthase [Candidatus Limnocylindrales bacterium]|nr:fused MFS/spermidine synthase [Candidatus Limnocylindrales bacterium]
MSAAPLSSSRQRALLLLCFFLSGAAGLIYQVAWAKSLALIFGSTVYAVTTVLAVFLGGLALGSDRIGRWSERRENPLRLYALLELGIAAFGAFSLLNLAGVRTLYVHAFPIIGDSVAPRGAFRFFAAAIVLLPPTFLMGGTFPVLVRGLGAQDFVLRARVSRLYWVNTFGAVVGALAAGFWLLPIAGGKLTVLAAAALNLLAGLIVFQMRSEKEAALEANPIRTKPPESSESRKFLLAGFSIVGAAAMAYEIAWTRLLAIMFGSSNYAFTVMLGTFLAGIALGSALFEFWTRRRVPSLRGFEATQMLTVLAALLFLSLLPHLPEVVVGILRATGNSFRGLLLAQAIASGLAMLPATIIFGFNFPLVVALLAESRAAGSSGESAAVGRAYAANTTGAIAGALLAGFWLLPLLGGFRLVAIAAAVNLLLAFALTVARKIVWLSSGMKFALAAALVAVVTSGAFYNRTLATFGAALYYPMHAKGVSLQEMAETNDVLFAADGPNATVAVIQSEDYLALRIDGKVDASNLDTRTQLLLGHLPAFFHPHPRRVLVIGFGSGMTLAALARYPEIERLDCVEIEPRVLRAAGYLEKLNGSVLSDPRVHIILDDARDFLSTTRESYDVISSEPSNPWMAGVANLYTSEFYREARARLAPGGLFVQWVQGYSLEPSDLRMVFRTFATEFPRVTLWRGEVADFLLLGQTSSAPPLSLDRLRAVWPQPKLQNDFKKLGLQDPDGLLAYHLLDDADVRRFSRDASFNTDNLTLLEFRAPKSLFAENLAEKNRMLIANSRSSILPQDVPAANPSEATLAAAETSDSLSDRERANYFLKPLLQADPSLAALLSHGRLELEEKRFADAREIFTQARKIDPQSLEAEAGLARATLGMGDSIASEKVLMDVLARDAKQPQAIIGMLELSTLAKNWKEAARWQAERIALDSEIGCREYVRLGRDYLRAGETAEGMQWLAKALERDSYCHPAHRTLADQAIAVHDWSNAKSHLEFFIRYAPDEDPTAYSSLAGVNIALGNVSAARAALEKGMRIFPGDENLRRLAVKTESAPR